MISRKKDWNFYGANPMKASAMRDEQITAAPRSIYAVHLEVAKS